MACNICGGVEFTNMAQRPNVRCISCNSLERTRLMKAVLDRELKVRPGLSILHLAPERGLSDYFQSLPEVRYRATDIVPEQYQHCAVERMDLTVDAEHLPDQSLDLIVHSHVMEHVPSNISAVLLHLHRALKADGLHIFSVPIFGETFEEDLGALPPEKRLARFGQDDHVRRFGREDIHNTLGKIFHIPAEYDLLKRYPDINLAAINIPARSARGYSSDTIFCLRKSDSIFRLS